MTRELPQNRVFPRIRAFTLVEALVGIGLASMLIYATWTIFVAAQADAQEAEFRLSAVSAAERVSVLLEADLAALCPRYDGGGEIEVDATGRTLKFWITDTGPDPRAGAVRVRPAGWAFDPARHTVTRTLGKAAEEVRGVLLADLAFRVTASPDLAAPLASPLPPADCLLVKLVWAPPETLRQGLPLDRHATSLALSFGLLRRSDLQRQSGWVSNPTSRYTLFDE